MTFLFFLNLQLARSPTSLICRYKLKCLSTLSLLKSCPCLFPDSSQDVVTVPKVSNFPDFFRLAETVTISAPDFPKTDSRISPLDVAFNDPSLRNYPPPAVTSSAVRPLSGQPVKRSFAKRQADQSFPNFFQQSQQEAGFAGPQFPDTMTR